MINLLSISLVIALMIQFVSACFWEGMIFGSINESLWNLTPKLRKPLFECAICMSPWWGSLFILLLWDTGFINLPDFGQWIMTLIIVGGINTVISLITNNGSETERTS